MNAGEHLLHCQTMLAILNNTKLIDKQGNKIRAITYKADFYFYDVKLKAWRIIDVKGSKATLTEVYKLKKKLLAYKGIIIEEVY